MNDIVSDESSDDMALWHRMDAAAHWRSRELYRRLANAYRQRYQTALQVIRTLESLPGVVSALQAQAQEGDRETGLVIWEVLNTHSADEV